VEDTIIMEFAQTAWLLARVAPMVKLALLAMLHLLYRQDSVFSNATMDSSKIVKIYVQLVIQHALCVAVLKFLVALVAMMASKF
jgi:hypothetical protein